MSATRRPLRVFRRGALAVMLWTASVSAQAKPESPPAATEIDWDGELGWPLAVQRKGVTLAVVGKDDNIVFELGQGQRSSWVQRVRFHRQVTWRHDLPPESLAEASLLVDKDAVYVVHYCVMSSGATVHALDLNTGRKRWSTPVQGLGPVSHSKYSNHVVLKMVRGHLVAFGNESQGRYIEVFDPHSGKMLSTRKLPAARPG